MTDAVAAIRTDITIDSKTAWVTHLWTTFNQQRQETLNSWLETRNYVYATDTSTTTNKKLPWKNSTTLPKLCQIRDNLHANYSAALFPNDKWLKWIGYSSEASSKDRAATITAYMQNKAREGDLRSVVSRLLDDYILYGNAFCTVDFEARYDDPESSSPTKSYIGPKAIRISPEDIVFNPKASSFENTFKIVRSTVTTGELAKLAQTNPSQNFWIQALENREKIRNVMSSYSQEDFNEAIAFEVDGFGNLQEYFMGDFVEVLEFYGDYYDHDTNQLHTNRMITVVDRTTVVRDVPIQTYSGRAPIHHVGWRDRPDNLWSMGPLDNLVGMQYRIDHLENLKADAMDLAVAPMLGIQGDVEPFEWTPFGEIHLDADGNITELGKSLNGVITSDNQIDKLEMKMELFAGAPREAAGVRTPGEKTAFEVQQLNNAAGRIFQEKITKFEINLFEKVLNDMLEASHRNMDGSDIIEVIDNDLGVKQFIEISRDDISANGIVRPIGARHFAQKAQELQNLVGVFSSPLGQLVMPHTSGKALTEYLNDAMGITGYEIFRENVAIVEQQETQALVNQASQDLEVQANTPVEEEPIPVDDMEGEL